MFPQPYHISASKANLHFIFKLYYLFAVMYCRPNPCALFMSPKPEGIFFTENKKRPYLLIRFCPLLLSDVSTPRDDRKPTSGQNCFGFCVWNSKGNCRIGGLRQWSLRETGPASFNCTRRDHSPSTFMSLRGSHNLCLWGNRNLKATRGGRQGRESSVLFSWTGKVRKIINK